MRVNKNTELTRCVGSFFCEEKKFQKILKNMLTNEEFGVILFKHLREWRNRQTRTFEGRVVIPYGFKSRLSHQTPPFLRWSFSLFSAVLSYEKANRNSLIYKELRLFFYVPKICVPSFRQYFPAQKIIRHLGTFRELFPILWLEFYFSFSITTLYFLFLYILIF